MDTIHEWLKPQVIWFVVGLVLLLLEFAIPGLIIVFFGIGAWIVAAICLFTDISLNTQLLIFIASSVVLLVALRRWAKTAFVGRVALSHKVEELEGFKGQKAIVTEKIDPNTNGRVEFRGSHWDAEASETIPEGTTVEIIDKKNITLIVKSF